MTAFQRVFRGSIGAATAVGGVVLASAATVAYADDGVTSVHPGRAPNGNKLPIYENPNDDGTVTLVVQQNPLSAHIATAREATADAVGSVRSVLQKGVSSWIDVERKVEREVKSILPKDEKLTPGIIYVLVAGLTGSVLTRTRSFPVRFLAPPALALAALPYFLPKTAHNLRAYLSGLEDKHAPEFAAKHDALNHNLEAHWELAIDRIRGVSHDAAQWSSKAAEGVENATGLRVGDALRRGQAAASAKLGETRSVIADEVAALREEVSKHTSTEPVKHVTLEKVATVVEQKPIAVVVVAAPVDEPAAETEAPTPVVVEVKAVEVKPVEPKPAETKPAETKPAETKPAETKPADSGKRLV
ncbi:hypothetical protein CspeluHIS016_0203160 [Cutaneotrichosporon spelunceum]|uniref:MICOS complex subunit n=1 Tax=Cutaneotrichosporon spelunceum TaxID=1672016 RepID=A0AAD3TR26_9TREE|nr:hypothetical protein CspeluHIS016_0203160 [Cutaneotrichosporon spelunceum]